MRTTTLVTCLWLTLLAPIAFAQSVTCDYDRAANFSTYRTYAWAPGAELNDPVGHARVVEAIDAALAAKGLARVEPGGGPQVLVAYRASFESTLEMNEIPKWSPFGAAASLHTVVLGTLAVEMIDVNAGTMVWVSRSTTEFSPIDKPQKRNNRIAKAAKKMLETYPPRR